MQKKIALTLSLLCTITLPLHSWSDQSRWKDNLPTNDVINDSSVINSGVTKNNLPTNKASNKKIFNKPVEILVRLKESSQLKAAVSMARSNYQFTRLLDSEIAVDNYLKTIPAKSVSAITSQKQDDLFSRAYAAMSSKEQALYRIYKVKVDAKDNLAKVMADLMLDPAVEIAEPNYLMEQFYQPVDPYFDKQWAHQMTKAQASWDRTLGSDSVVVAVIDSGVDYNHPDLAPNIWRDAQGNPGRDFVDIDINLYLSYGYTAAEGEDYTGIDNDPMDFNGHGTHCAGIIAADNNSIGVIGVAPNVKIMPLRAGFTLKARDNEYGLLDNGAIINAIKYATDNGASIISMSFGSFESSIMLKEVLEYAASKGVIQFAAAGNSGNEIPSFPSSYDSVIAVGAVNSQGARSYYSNWGNWVDIAAPGGENSSDTMILSTVPTRINADGYEYFQGTSMAAPYAAGSAALLLSLDNTLTQEEIKYLLVKGGSEIRAGSVPAASIVELDKVHRIIAQPGLQASITTPVSEAHLTDGFVDIIGSATGDSFTLEYSEGRYSNERVMIARGSNVVDGSLGVLDLSSVPDGEFSLILTVSTGSDEIVTRTELFKNMRGQWGSGANKYVYTRRSNPIIVDLNGDNKKEIIVANDYFRDMARRLYVFNENGTLYSNQWPTNLPLDSIFPPSAGDITGDENLEVLLPSNGAQLFLFSDSGKLLASYKGSKSYGVPQLYDVDGDGKLEIVTTSRELVNGIGISSVDILNGQLENITSFTLDGPFLENQNALFGDIDADGEMDIFTAAYEDSGKYSDYYEKDQTQFTLYHADGTKKWQKRVEGIWPLGTALLADLDRNGDLEVIISMLKWDATIPGFSYSIHVLDKNGNPFKYGDWPVYVKNLQNFTLADTTGDGIPEIVVRSGHNPILINQNDSTVTVYNQSGQIVNDFTVDVMLSTNIVTADINNDGDVDFIANAFREEKLYAFGKDGATLDGFPKVWAGGGAAYVGASPAIADLDGNGTVEIVGGSWIRTFNLSDVDANRLEWSMADYDAQRSRTYPSAFDGTFLSIYPRVYFRGTSNEWGSTPMALVDSHVWEITIQSSRNIRGRFKFDVNRDWRISFGDNNADNIADPLGHDIYLSGKGEYIIRFNDKTLHYSVTKM